VRYFLVLVAVNLMWAFQFAGAKIATENLGPLTVTVLPVILSTLLLAPFIFLKRKRPETPPPSGWRLAAECAVLGIFGSLFSQLGLTWGVQRSLASNAAVLTLTIPVLTAALAAVMLGEKMTRVRWISFLLAIAGVVMVSDIDWGSVELVKGGYLLGNVLIFASCFGSAFYNTFSKRLLRWLDPVEVLVYSFIATTAVLLPMALAREPESFRRVLELGWPVWASLLTIALFSLALSMVLFLWVIDRIDVTQASLSIYLLPVFGVIISAITLRESVTWELVAGGVMVFLSTFLVTIYEERKKAARAAA
jgi:drug/metabolite transporter (DMT)-like permease